MAFTVWGAFDAFRKTEVDIDPGITKIARSSRDFLVQQLLSVSRTTTSFPTFTGKYQHFGSFARRTKIRPLNDIDLMIELNGAGTREHQTSTFNKYWLRMDDKTKPLAGFLDDYGYVNSTRVLNKISNSLGSISQYSKAEIRKTKQAITLNLKSYDWVFDIVPAIAVANADGGTTHYLIPDGSGEWIRTDPRVDSKNMTNANVQHGGNLLPVMRLLKYWNNRVGTKSRLPSYYFETLVLNTFQYVQSISSLQEGIKYFLNAGVFYLDISCADPKGLGSALDANITGDVKQKVANVMRQAATNASYAIMYEKNDDHKTAIYWWTQVFGSRFPSYGY